MENETSHHIQQLDEKCSFNEEEEEDDEEMEEDNQENHYSDSNGDSEHNEEDYQNPEPEIENEEIYLEGQNLPVCETEPNCNTNEDEESCKEEEEEEVKINQPQRESRENLKAYLNNNSETTKESNYIKECIFETGNMVKDANLLFNEDTNENHFISIDSICEKTEKSMKMSFKDESLVFREKNE